MKRKIARRYLGAGSCVLLLALFLLRSEDRLGAGETLEGAANGRPGLLSHGSSASTHASSRPTKTNRPRTEKRPAPDAEQEKFKRFFLPPITLENATLDEAIAAVVSAYEEAARLTGETAQPLDVDHSAAAPRETVSAITPRAPADTVLRHVAALFGHRLKGSLPNFELLALGRSPHRKGRLPAAPGLESLLASHLERQQNPAKAELPRDPFDGLEQPSELFFSDPETTEADQEPAPGIDLQALLAAQGFNPEAEFKVNPDGSLAYENLSEAEVEKLASLVQLASGGDIGPMQMKSGMKIMSVNDSIATSVLSGAAMNAEETQSLLREVAMVKGCELMTLPVISARQGEIGTVLITDQQVHDPTQWNGVKMATTSVPYGLGSQVEFAVDIRDPDGTSSRGRGANFLPAAGNGVLVIPQGNGKKLIVMQTAEVVDATGKPLTPPH